MRLLFIVQGEGRGHLTQAISLSQLLQAAGHEIVGAWINVAEERPIPPFFIDQFNAHITPITGPLLVYDPVTNALNLNATIRGIMINAASYRRSLRQLYEAICTEKPDVVVNFFEVLGGLTYAMYKPPAPMVCIGHQCLTVHPAFAFPPGRWLDRQLFKMLVRLNTWGATELFGLSFDEQPDAPAHRLRVMPPLLRQELSACDATPPPDASPYVLAYTTQPGLVSEVVHAHRQRPDVMVHYFKANAELSAQQVDERLIYHRIDGRRYLSYMRHCQAVLTTAGFESVCEALYFGKPVLMMPQPNHFEQACNALDGVRAGAGITADCFDLNQLLTSLPYYDPTSQERFRNWYQTGSDRFINALLRISKQVIPTQLNQPVP